MKYKNNGITIIVAEQQSQIAEPTVPAAAVVASTKTNKTVNCFCSTYVNFNNQIGMKGSTGIHSEKRIRMIERTNERVSEGKNEQMNERMNEWMDGWIEKKMALNQPSENSYYVFIW